MEAEEPTAYDVTPIMDSFDIDLVIKVLNHIAFSPYFTSLVPVFYYFQGARWPDSVVVWSAAWSALVCVFWLVKWISRLYRNQGSLFFGPGRFDWGDQIVVVTGGASGIGELIANTLAVRNVTVAVLDINPIITENFNIEYYKCDVSKWEEVEAAAKKIQEELGHPTVLINNAGVVQGKPLIDLSPEDIQQTFSVNTIGHFHTLKAFLPEMIKQKKGHIITMSSVAGVVGMARMTDYNASKAALNSLHESLRYELDHVYKTPAIRTTLVVAGHTLTRLFSTVKLPKSAWYKFLVPSVPPVAIAKAVITALDEQHSQTIYLPFYANFAPFLPLMPSFVRDFGQWLSGADYAMEDFVKMSGRRSDEGKVPDADAETKNY